MYNKFAETQIKLNEDIRFINLGYHSSEKLALLGKDEPYRLSIQLYHELLKGIDVNGKNVLEIGCGFGGGCYYLANYHKPEQVTGIDLSDKNIARCIKIHNSPIIQFKEGDAEDTGFASESFDVIVNLESSHGYPSRDTKFCHEVARLLRPGGYFAYGDLFGEKQFKSFTMALNEAGMIQLSEKDITKEVLQARPMLQYKSVNTDNKPFWMPLFKYKNLTVSNDSATYKAMTEGRIRYKLFTFKKGVKDE